MSPPRSFRLVVRALALLVALGALAGCALRPRYAEFVVAQTTEPVRLQLVERSSGMPVVAARIEVGESRGKLTLTTDAEGCFVLPVDKKLLEENALLVVTAPPGVGRTAVVAPGTWGAAALPPVERLEPVPAGGVEGAAVEGDSGDAGT